MVFVALTPSGLQEALKLAAQHSAAVWCSANAISEDDFRKHEGRSLTRFAESVSFAHQDGVKGAISTIEEHHPSERIWLETNDLDEFKK